jgi:hypothetical protein
MGSAEHAQVRESVRIARLMLPALPFVCAGGVKQPGGAHAVRFGLHSMVGPTRCCGSHVFALLEVVGAECQRMP